MTNLPMCPVCKKALEPGQLCLAIPVVYELMQGQKDPDFVHWVPHGDPNQPPEVIHLACVNEYFDPQWDEDMYDAIKDRMQQEIEEESRSEMYNEAYAEAETDIFNRLAEQDVAYMCPECCTPVRGPEYDAYIREQEQNQAAPDPPAVFNGIPQPVR